MGVALKALRNGQGGAVVRIPTLAELEMTLFAGALQMPGGMDEDRFDMPYPH
jgi:hypothetical protein